MLFEEDDADTLKEIATAILLGLFALVAFVVVAFLIGTVVWYTLEFCFWLLLSIVGATK